MSTATIHGMTVPLDAFGRPSEPFATQADMEARASLSAALRCAHSGKLDNALDHARDAYDNEDAPIELRLEAAKLCIDWHAALGAYGQCRKVASDAALLGTSYLERDHPLILMLRNSEAYWLAILGDEDMAARKFSALVCDVKNSPTLDSQLAFAIRNNSAMPWKNTGKWSRAARVYRELLADMEPECDEEDMTVLTVRDNLAEVLSASTRRRSACTRPTWRSSCASRTSATGASCACAMRLRATPGWEGIGTPARTCGRSWRRIAAATSVTATR